jgi:hypothetical protein
VSAGLLTWGWTFTSNNQIAFGHIGASYNNATGTLKGNNASITSATLDGPATLFLLGAGLIVFVGFARKLDPGKSS